MVPLMYVVSNQDYLHLTCFVFLFVISIAEIQIKYLLLENVVIFSDNNQQRE